MLRLLERWEDEIEWRWHIREIRYLKEEVIVWNKNE